MSSTKLYIVPIAVDVINGKYYTIVINDENASNPMGVSLPFVENNTSLDIDLQIQNCISSYIHVNPEWLKINLFNRVRNNNNQLEIFYYFSVPYASLKIVNEIETAVINFDILCANDPFLCNLKYFV